MYDDKQNSKKSSNILDDGATRVQVAGIEQVTIKICLKYNRITLN